MFSLSRERRWRLAAHFPCPVGEEDINVLFLLTELLLVGVTSRARSWIVNAHRKRKEVLQIVQHRNTLCSLCSEVEVTSYEISWSERRRFTRHWNVWRLKWEWVPPYVVRLKSSPNIEWNSMPDWNRLIWRPYVSTGHASRALLLILEFDMVRITRKLLFQALKTHYGGTNREQKTKISNLALTQ